MSKAKTRQAICQHVARLLREAREGRSLSMTQVAKDCGLSQQSVSYIERGKRLPTLDTMIRIADALGTRLSEVIREAEDRSGAGKHV